jgi:hypothetical protein
MFFPGTRKPEEWTLRDEKGQRGQVFSWSASDWNFLQEMHALDIEYFAGSMLFQIWMSKNGTREQQEYLESLNVGFRMSRQMKLKPGDTVRAVGERGTAKIRAILTSMHGALSEMQIGGFRNWNLDELRLVKRKKDGTARG